MQNPFLKERRYTLAYVITWILLAGIHVIVLWLWADFEIIPAIIDSLIFNVLFAGLGVSIWFTIRFRNNQSGTIIDQLFNHLVTGLVAVALWLGIGYLVAYYVFADHISYQEFLNGSIPWRAISGIFFYSVIVLIYYLYINYQDRRKRIHQEAGLRLQVREAEIDRLKAQINPHFLFNSLNSISSLIQSRPAEAREMIVKLSGFLRYSLEYKENELTTLQNEIDYVQHYLDIEKVRFGERLLIALEVKPECLSMKLPHMILQPLIENSIKHGVYESTDPVEIHLQADCQGRGELFITISNSYDPEAPPRTGKGIGLKNTQNRLFLVYNLDKLLHVDSKDNTFVVQLSIPQNNNYGTSIESPDH